MSVRLPPELEELLSLPGVPAKARPTAPAPAPTGTKATQRRNDLPRCECCGALADPDPADNVQLCVGCGSGECEMCAATRLGDDDEVCYEDLVDGDG